MSIYYINIAGFNLFALFIILMAIIILYSVNLKLKD